MQKQLGGFKNAAKLYNIIIIITTMWFQFYNMSILYTAIIYDRILLHSDNNYYYYYYKKKN